jgi:peptide chain release factor 2
LKRLCPAWRGGFDIENKKIRVKELEAEMSDADFWADREKADSKIKLLGESRDLIDRYEEVKKVIENLKTNLIEDKFFEAKRKFRELEIREIFKGRYDKQSAIISFYPGAGGEDAEDWARMLAEMYKKYALDHRWQVAVLDDSPNRRSFEIKGDYAYGYLKHEIGVHRLVRISPFSAKKLRHTSFALVEVVPDLPSLDESKFEIPEKDLKFEFSRSGGPGGQNVNKVETAVRVTHLPTGLTAGSQVERSQAQNRERALKVLKAKLFQLMEKNQVRELSGLRTKIKPEWGNQIRSYVLNPYQMVKDHRTNVETSRVEGVLNGGLDEFIEADIEMLSDKKEQYIQ